MRRALGYVTFILGWVLIFMSPLLLAYTTPRVAKAPTDVYDRSVSDGTGSYFSVKGFHMVGPTKLQNISIAKGDPARSTNEVAVVSLFSRTVDVNTGADIDYGLDVYAFDRSTGYAVHCCGEKPVAAGLTLKFPFHTKKGTYRFWDSTAKSAFPASYVRTDSVDGLTAYVFAIHVPSTVLGHTSIPGFIVNSPHTSVSAIRYYRATTTLWVEPTTGAIIKGGSSSQQWLADEIGKPLLTLANVNFVNSNASVQETVDRVKPRLWELRLVSVYLPILGPILGIALVAGGFLLIRSADRVGRAAIEPAFAGEPAQAADA